MGRQEMSQADMARALGENEMWVFRRIRGKQQMTIADIERMAKVLGVPVIEFFHLSRSAGSASRGSDLNGSSDKTSRSDLNRPARRRSTERRNETPSIHTGSPFDHQRRDHTRPISAPPVTSRRPQRIGPGVHPMAS